MKKHNLYTTLKVGVLTIGSLWTTSVFAKGFVCEGCRQNCNRNSTVHLCPACKKLKTEQQARVILCPQTIISLLIENLDSFREGNSRNDIINPLTNEQLIDLYEFTHYVLNSSGIDRRILQTEIWTQFDKNKKYLVQTKKLLSEHIKSHFVLDFRANSLAGLIRKLMPLGQKDLNKSMSELTRDDAQDLLFVVESIVSNWTTIWTELPEIREIIKLKGPLWWSVFFARLKSAVRTNPPSGSHKIPANPQGSIVSQTTSSQNSLFTDPKQNHASSSDTNASEPSESGSEDTTKKQKEDKTSENNEVEVPVESPIDTQIVEEASSDSQSTSSMRSSSIPQAASEEALFFMIQFLRDALGEYGYDEGYSYELSEILRLIDLNSDSLNLAELCQLSMDEIGNLLPVAKVLQRNLPNGQEGVMEAFINRLNLKLLALSNRLQERIYELCTPAQTPALDSNAKSKAKTKDLISPVSPAYYTPVLLKF